MERRYGSDTTANGNTNSKRQDYEKHMDQVRRQVQRFDITMSGVIAEEMPEMLRKYIQAPQIVQHAAEPDPRIATIISDLGAYRREIENGRQSSVEAVRMVNTALDNMKERLTTLQPPPVGTPSAGIQPMDVDRNPKADKKLIEELQQQIETLKATPQVTADSDLAKKIAELQGLVVASNEDIY